MTINFLQSYILGSGKTVQCELLKVALNMLYGDDYCEVIAMDAYHHYNSYLGWFNLIFLFIMSRVALSGTRWKKTSAQGFQRTSNYIRYKINDR